MADEHRYRIHRPASQVQAEARESILRYMQDSPVPRDELLDQLPLFSSRHALGRVFMMQALYERILDVHGAVLVFGVRWGRDMAILQTLRAILEPNNTARRIIGFDTFSGFPAVSDQDGGNQVGDFGVPPGYAQVLESILHQRDVEDGNLYPRREIVEGDVVESLPRWLREHPETVIAMAYFDMDLYEPTRAALDAIRPHVTRGTLVGFDEASHPLYPGETVALREAWGLPDVRLQRTRFAGTPSFFVVE
ncbi:TylF/MycF/NovP-related O-methyltransferase [Kineococcus glutinatus]